MAENVQTGGNMKFEYPKNYRRPGIDITEQKEIDDAYEDYYKRKRKEFIWKIIMWIIIGLIVLAGGIYLILKS